MSLRSRFDVDAILPRGHIEGCSRAGIVHLGLVPNTEKIVVGASVVDIPAEGHFPNSIIVLALIGEFLVDLRRNAVLECQHNLYELWTNKSKADLRCLRSPLQVQDRV